VLICVDDCAPALPTALTLPPPFPVAAALPTTNFKMVFGMIASIHKCDGGKISDSTP
jgi:hypothetical protein